MKIRWIGHASFQIETAEGIRVRTDPYDDSIGLPVSSLPADVVTVSHGHFDHNATALVPDKPVVVDSPGRHTAKGIQFNGVPTYHDEAHGAKRGRNIVFVMLADGLTLAHLGDLGHVPDEEQAAAIGKVDIIMVPVGGVYTLDAAGAARVTDTLKPKIVIPMHYKIPGLGVGVGGVEPFLVGRKDIRRLDQLTVEKAELPEGPEVVVLMPRP